MDEARHKFGTRPLFEKQDDQALPSKNPARITVFWDKYQIRDYVGVLAEPLNAFSTSKPEAEGDKTVTSTVTLDIRVP